MCLVVDVVDVERRVLVSVVVVPIIIKIIGKDKINF